jgi:pimeloyl-ACP methyl ester carboxylesterase
MRRIRLLISSGLSMLILWVLSSAAQAELCLVGVYRLDDGRAFDIGPAPDGLRWRLEDGRSGKLTRATDANWTSTRGWTERPDGHRFNGSCASAEIQFDGVHGQKIALEATEVKFAVDSAELAGRLLMPPGNARVPVVVLVHGSESSSARESYALQRQLPAAGVGVFVYDKRGTGGSTGAYTHDYPVLAADVVAAVKEACRLAGRRTTRVGLQGSSQGGWVAPLAATLTRVDFVIAAYGLAVSPLDEDREAVALDMARHGFGTDETRKALEVASAAEAIIRSGFTRGYTDLEALRARYAGEPWFRYLRGNVTGLLLSEPEAFWREKGPVLLAGILPDYDPMPVLKKLRTPQLWILGADDIDAPPMETWRRLLALRKAGLPISAVMFPRAEHGMYEYELNPKGERDSTRQPAGYFRLMRDFIVTGEIERQYGDAVVVR